MRRSKSICYASFARYQSQMQNLISYINGLGGLTSKTAFGYPVYAAKSPVIFLDSYKIDGVIGSSDGKELVRFSKDQKIGKINEFKWFNQTLMVKVAFDKPIPKPGFVNSVAAWVRPADLLVSNPIATVVTSGNKLYYSTGSRVNFRATASTSGKSLGKLSKGEEIGESDGKATNIVGGIGWLKFTHPVWGVGYVRQDYTSTTKPVVAGSSIPKPTETGTPASKLPIQNPFSSPTATDSNDQTQTYILAAVGVIALSFIGYLVYNANKTKKLFKQIGNGNKLK